MKRILAMTSAGLLGILILTGGAQGTTLFLDSWGVGYGSWDPTSPSAPSAMYYYVEDWTGDPANGWLNPGWGGDDYDVEAVYAAYDNDYVYLAVVTGFPQKGRFRFPDYHQPGDIAVDTNLSGDYDLAVDTSADGLVRRGNLTWQDPVMGGFNPWHGVSDPLRVTGWSQTLSSVDWSYGEFAGRYAIETVLDRNLIDPENGFAVHWTMGCGNDAGDLAISVADPVPEPASIALLGLGLLGGGLARKLRRKKS